MKKIFFTKLYLPLICIALLMLGILSCKPERPQSTQVTEITTDTIPGSDEGLAPVDSGVHSQLSDTATLKAANAKPDSLKKKKPLTVIVDNLESPSGPIVMGFYSPDRKFLDETDQLKEYRIKPKKGKFNVDLSDLPYGVYAVAIYQDVNSNGHIDKTMGIPREPYAFSNNYHPRTHAPSFDDCKFTYDEKSTTVRMTLIK